MLKMGVSLYLCYWYASCLWHDFDDRVRINIKKVVSEMEVCAVNFEVNKCNAENVIPKLQVQCKEWELCMTQDPYLVAKRGIWSSQLFGQTFNAFFEELSWPAMAFLIFLLWDRILLQFGFVRAMFGVKRDRDLLEHEHED